MSWFRPLTSVRKPDKRFRQLRLPVAVHAPDAQYLALRALVRLTILVEPLSPRSPRTVRPEAAMKTEVEELESVRGVGGGILVGKRVK